jgi:hypothetical protein
MSSHQESLKPSSQYITPFTGLSAPVGGEVNSGFARMLGLLRDTRAEVQNLQTTLHQILTKADMVDQITRAREIFAVLRNNAEIYEYNGAQINGRLKELRALTGSDAFLYDRYGDEITHIENHWERAVKSWPVLPEDVATNDAAINDSDITLAEDIVAGARQVNAHLKEMIYHIGLLTVPSRLNQHLEQLRIGQALDFHTTFKDEIGNDGDRSKILTYLAARPQAIPNGVINLDKAIVLRAAADIGRRRQSYLYILLTVLFGGVLAWVVAVVGDWFTLEDWPIASSQATDLLVAYAFVMLGGAVHLGVDGIKQARSDGQAGVLAIEDWFTWFHIHEVDVIIGIMSMWIGFFGLALFTGQVEWQTAFLVGYSVDSFVDIFLQRFNATVATGTANIAV